MINTATNGGIVSPMRALLVFLLATTACNFSGSGGSSDGGPDGLPDALPDGLPDGTPTLGCITGLYDICTGVPKPTMALTVSGTMRINTNTESNCHRIITQDSGPALCVQYYTSVTIPVGATLIAHGNRAFAMWASNSLTIAGTLDVSTHRNTQTTEPGAGQMPSCTFGSVPESDIGGSGGGAGGTFATQGGAGGTGDMDMEGVDQEATGGMAGAVAPFSVLRGGCQGQRGAGGTTGIGGGGGGAVYLSSRVIQISGSVLAAGAGGSGGGADASGAGGGGGGSGGTIVLEGFTSATVAATGLLIATGGGGGQGGTSMSVGEAGEEPSSAAAAAGGDQMLSGGNGGNGATTADGAPGVANNAGGGGGGGGAGYIRIRSGAPTTLGAAIAPAPDITTL